MVAAGAEPAVVVYSRSVLGERLAAWPGNNGDVTWALVVAGAIPTAGELAAMKEASGLCDRVVCVRLRDRNRPVAPNYAETLRSAGVDVVWLAREEVDGPVRMDLGVDELGEGATILFQAVMAALPLLVVVPRGDIPLVRACRNLQAGAGDLFSLRVVGDS